MAENKKITELATASTPTGAELFELVQGGVNKKATLNDVIALTAPDFVQSVVDTSGTTVVLDFEDTLKGSFTGSVTFAAPRTITRANESRAIEYDFMFEVTAVDVPIDFGSDTRSPDARFLDGVFTPADVGLYKVKGTRYGPGGLWLLDFNGVYSVGDAPPDPPDPGDSWVIGSGIWNDTAVWKDTGIWKDNP
jgi:hypothetical protein